MFQICFPFKGDSMQHFYKKSGQKLEVLQIWSNTLYTDV
jgi:hypothetical protein